jgi:DNA-binding MarR family transcriptional regulator
MVPASSLADQVHAIQRHYPQIYLACHRRHRRAASSEHGISARDSSLLSHLDRERPMSPSRLARHLGVAASTLSAAVERLVRLGLIERVRDARDRRRGELRLSARGAEAMSAASVLDPQRLTSLLSRMAPRERARAVEGLALLANAAAASAS